MGPTCKRRTRKSRRTIYKKQSHQFKNEEFDSPCTTPTKDSNNTPLILDHHDISFGMMDSSNYCSSPCATPKAEKFRIPEIKTCPPAPKKRRVLSSCSSLRRRSPIAFFAPPDLELFFIVALRDIST